MTNYSLKLLITGADGQLGHALLHHERASDFQLIPCGRYALDITNALSISQAINQHRPDVVINTAAYTAVDKAENEKETALLVNQKGPALLAETCKTHSIPLIHLSTDYVFDGKKTSPYAENDAISPINHYGHSKWLGEEAVREAHAEHIILRVSGVFSEYKHNFLNTMLRFAHSKQLLSIVSDQLTCPTYADDIADALFAMASTRAHWGTYHYCSAQSLSWYEFTCAIMNEIKHYQSIMVEKIEPIASKDYKTEAKRPAFSVLNCRKIQQDFAIPQPSLEKSLAHAVKKIIGKN